MGKLVVVEWISVDGVFDTALFDTWFFPFDSAERQEYIRQATLSNTAILYGRKTYEELAAYWPDNTDPALSAITQKLNQTPKYVVSNSLTEPAWKNTTVLSGDVFTQIEALKKQPDQLIHVNGSATLVKSLAEKGLIDELQLLIHPIVVGTGKRFFVDSMGISGMECLGVQQLEKGVLLVTYRATT